MELAQFVSVRVNIDDPTIEELLEAADASVIFFMRGASDSLVEILLPHAEFTSFLLCYFVFMSLVLKCQRCRADRYGNRRTMLVVPLSQPL